MSSDNQYTALGPAAIGFQTDGTNIDQGANIAGKLLGIRGHGDVGIGVHGESAGLADGAPGTSIGVLGEGQSVGVRGTSHLIGVEGISGAGSGVRGRGTPGVFGQGDKNGATGHNGVMGVIEGSEGAGVFGGHRKVATTPLDVTSFDPAGPPGVGVFGVSTDNGNGVMGQSHFGHGVIGTSEGGVEFKSHGIFGRSTQTAGVVGISGGEKSISKNPFPSGHAGVFGFSDQGTGVFGSSSAEFTHGVRGSSVSGDGLLGTSTHGRGGVFQTGDTASPKLVPQLQLVPHKLEVPSTVPAQPLMFIPSQDLLSALPKEGRPGDLLATTDASGVCTLWFCVHGIDGATSAQWCQVLLGVPLPGGD